MSAKETKTKKSFFERRKKVEDMLARKTLNKKTYSKKGLPRYLKEVVGA